jgi:hypothetical protein
MEVCIYNMDGFSSLRPTGFAVSRPGLFIAPIIEGIPVDSRGQKTTDLWLSLPVRV